jgi:menaquinol-cytochrome c reductase iron-sulfur subunit
MDANEQNAVSAETIQSEPESVRAAKHSRRSFMFKLALLANGAVGAVLAVPIIGYLLGPAMRKGG